MSNKETLQEYNTKLTGNGVSLDSVLEVINELPSSEMFATNEYVDEQLSTKQPLLTAGENITIVDNVISATGGGSGESVDLSNYYTKEEVNEKIEYACEDSTNVIRYHIYGEFYTGGSVGSDSISKTSDMGIALLNAMQDAYDNKDKYMWACFILHSTHTNGTYALTPKCYVKTYNLSSNRFSPRIKYSSDRECYFSVTTPTISNGVVSVSGSSVGTLTTGKVVSTSTVLEKTNTTAFTPTGDYHPATKKYVDDAIAAAVTAAVTTALEGEY